MQKRVGKDAAGCAAQVKSGGSACDPCLPQPEGISSRRGMVFALLSFHSQRDSPPATEEAYGAASVIVPNTRAGAVQGCQPSMMSGVTLSVPETEDGQDKRRSWCASQGRGEAHARVR